MRKLQSLYRSVAAFAIVACGLRMVVTPADAEGASRYLGWISLSQAGYKHDDWSERGVFVFGALVLDFHRGRYSAGPIKGRLFNCSNGSFFCMNSTKSSLENLTFQLVLPRSCEKIRRSKPGDVWLLGHVRTEILGIEVSEVDKTLYLGDPRFPHVAYIYSLADGVKKIIRTYRGVDWVKRLKSGKVDEAEIGKSGSELKTFDPFGKCEE